MPTHRAMSEPIWAQPFPAGVTDAGLRHALLRDATGRIVALRLSDGQLLWRSAEAMLPLLLDDELAVALAMAPPRAVALSLQGPAAGSQGWTSGTLAWPAWAQRAATPNAVSEFHAAWIDGDVLLHWRLRAQTLGGASRGLPRPDPTEGACTIERATGIVHALDTWPRPPDDEGVDTSSADPAVLAQRALADVRYRLLQQLDGERLRTSLTAQHATRGEPLWSCPLDDVPRPRAPARRP